MESVRVLVVEDNAADAAYTRAILGDEFRVAIASRLNEALAHISAAAFDVALVDMNLPDATGLSVFEQIHEAAPHLPVVILSGDDDERMSTAAVQAGAQDYLLKGHVSDVSLRRALRYAIERQDLTDRLEASIRELGHQRTSVIDLNQSKNDLIAVLAHDIKGPLTSIVGFAELLEEGYLEGDGATDAARTIRSNAQRLATLANDVLALSRVEHGELEIADERVDLAEILQNAVELHGAERAIHFDRGVDEAPVRGDADRLRQVFDNVIRNAIKYSPGGNPVELSLQAANDTYCVDVRDRGIGVPADELPKLFERFSRATNARKAKIQGTGIGLFIVKMIVERHGGTVGVQSAVGEGSTFSVTLPKIETAAMAAPRRVSILTGDRNLSRFATYELRSRGYRVRESASVEELVEDGDVRPGDVILADAGTASARELRERFAGGDVRVVGIGASGDGWDANLPKPFLVADLIAAVANAR